MEAKPKVSSPTATSEDQDRVSGIRADIRRVLYLGFKYELGCPTEAKCPLYARSQETACQPCTKHLKPVESDPNTLSLRRIRFLFWLESLIGAGCHPSPDDLPVNVWEALSYMKAERNRFERLLHEAKADNREQDRAIAKAQQDARKLDGLPAPGGSIFKKGT